MKNEKMNNYFEKMAKLFICLLVLSFAKLQAQQTPVFSTYFFNRFMINPGFTGIDNQYRGFGFYRSQWGNMPGRPITGGVTLEGSFWKDRIGAGVFVMNDKIGIFDQTNVSFSYAQKIKFAKEHQISIGVQGSAFINRIDFSRSTTSDFNDPSLLDQRTTKAVFDLNIGISYKWRGLLVGFAIPQVIQPNAKYANGTTGSSNYKYIRHYNAFVQYRINTFKGKFNITPTLFMRKGAYTGFQFDATLMLDYKNIVFAGAGYRNSFGAIVMAGVNILDMFTVAYAFDFTTQKTLRGQVGATHEITAGFHLPSNYKKKKKKDVIEVSEVDAMLSGLQRSNDSLGYRLKYTKHQADSLAAVLRNLKTQEAAAKEAARNADARKADSLEQVINSLNSLFKNQRGVTDVAGGTSTAYTLDKIFFESDKATLLPASQTQLDLLVDFMKSFPKVEILIKGHADISGNEQENQILSENRAEAVSVYLMQHGIANNRLSFQGFGTKFPIADNSTAEGRRLNRRVEFTILKQ